MEPLGPQILLETEDLFFWVRVPPGGPCVGVLASVGKSVTSAAVFPHRDFVSLGRPLRCLVCDPLHSRDCGFALCCGRSRVLALSAREERPHVRAPDLDPTPSAAIRNTRLRSRDSSPLARRRRWENHCRSTTHSAPARQGLAILRQHDWQAWQARPRPEAAVRREV